MSGQIGKLKGQISPKGSISGKMNSKGNLSGGLSLPTGGGGTYKLKPATTDRLGGIIVGEDLSITEEGVLSVIKADIVEEDNTRPITAAAVYTEVGNINALLELI